MREAGICSLPAFCLLDTLRLFYYNNIDNFVLFLPFAKICQLTQGRSWSVRSMDKRIGPAELVKMDSTEIRRINRARIYQYLYENGAQSRKNIADALGLSMPTVVQNLLEMKAQGLVEEAGMLASTGGRKAVAVQVHRDVRFAVGLDITRSHISVVILNVKGDVLCRRRVYRPFELRSAYFEGIAARVEAAVDAAGIDRARILGVGVSIPAIIVGDGTGVTTSFILGDITLDHFRAVLPYPCRLCNDASAAARAEQCISGQADSFIYLCLSSSVGGAIVQNGILNSGVNQRSAEFGHMTIVPEGRRCYCGKSGCFDAYCNANLLMRHSDGDLEKFFRLVEQGAVEAVAAWDEYLYYLAVMINNLRTAFDHTVVLGGYVGYHIQRYLPRLRQLVAQRNTFSDDGSYIQTGHYQNFEASAVGAAHLYISEFLRNI